MTMLLHSRMASIPCSPHHSLSPIKDIEHLFSKSISNSRLIVTQSSPSSTKSGLQYFNMRVTQRLRRYRSMKKQWQEIATSVQNTSRSPTCESPIRQDSPKNSSQKPIHDGKCYYINENINTVTTIKDPIEKISNEFDPLHSRIEQDLIKLRKFMKKKHHKLTNDHSLSYKVSMNNHRPMAEITLTNTALDEQENSNISTLRKTPSINKLKPLDRVKIAGYSMRPPAVLSKSDSVDSGAGSISNASSICSQYCKSYRLKRQNTNKTFNIYHSRVNPSHHPQPPHSSDSFFYRSSYFSKKKYHSSPKISQNHLSRQSMNPSRLAVSLSSVLETKSSNLTKHEIPLPPIRKISEHNETTAATTRFYTYAASTSSATPRSMILKRNTSLLPILLQSSSCIGIQPIKIHSNQLSPNREEAEEEEQDDDGDDDEQEDIPEETDDYYHLLHYNHLINRLPKPIISIIPRHGQDDYGILFEQLDHIRQTMPDSNIYQDYARI